LTLFGGFVEKKCGVGL